jgi:hypothetical protein
VGGPGTPPFGARGMSSVRYGTWLGDLKNKQPTHTSKLKDSETPLLQAVVTTRSLSNFEFKVFTATTNHKSVLLGFLTRPLKMRVEDGYLALGRNSVRGSRRNADADSGGVLSVSDKSHSRERELFVCTAFQ